MREHAGKLVILGLLALIVGLPLLLQRTPEESAAVVEAHTPRLIIITPHNEQIRHEFGRAFNLWRASQNLPHVEFDWRSMGGGSDLRKIVLSQLEAAARQGREDQGFGVDLFFGGGDYEHNQLVRGVRIERDGEMISIPATVQPDLPPGLLEAAFPEATIGGERLYHPDGYWIGVVLSSFGIVYNRDVLDVLDLPEPVTWVDLTDPGYASWLALADPAHSGSVSATMHAVVRRQGWHEGWRTMREIFANARYFTSSASKVPVDVSAGEAAAGMCIDFYGRFQAGAVGGERVGYVDPPFATAITADPISLLRGAPNRDLAEQFIAWLLTHDAQALWQRKIGSPGGPERFELRRLPARQDVYTAAETAHWTDPQVNPFKTAAPVPAGMPDVYLMIAPVAHAMAIDIHDDLVTAWRTIQHVPHDHPLRKMMLVEFHRMPPELTLAWPETLRQSWRDAVASPEHPQHEQAVATLRDFGQSLAQNFYGSANPQRLQEARIRWTYFFRDQYAKVVAMGDSVRE